MAGNNDAFVEGRGGIPSGAHWQWKRDLVAGVKGNKRKYEESFVLPPTIDYEGNQLPNIDYAHRADVMKSQNEYYEHLKQLEAQRSKSQSASKPKPASTPKAKGPNPLDEIVIPGGRGNGPVEMQSGGPKPGKLLGNHINALATLVQNVASSLIATRHPDLVLRGSEAHNLINLGKSETDEKSLGARDHIGMGDMALKDLSDRNRAVTAHEHYKKAGTIVKQAAAILAHPEVKTAINSLPESTRAGVIYELPSFDTMDKAIEYSNLQRLDPNPYPTVPFGGQTLELNSPEALNARANAKRLGKGSSPAEKRAAAKLRRQAKGTPRGTGDNPVPKASESSPGSGSQANNNTPRIMRAPE
jgi:hypothetical protein